MPRSDRAKPLEWARTARDAFNASIEFIASEDIFTTRLVVERVENALRLIQSHPKIGRPAGALGRRAFPILMSFISCASALISSCVRSACALLTMDRRTKTRTGDHGLSAMFYSLKARRQAILLGDDGICDAKSH